MAQTSSSMWAIYLVTYLASHVWLSGSLLLPCMLLVRWYAAKWKTLHRLATSKGRWTLIWGCYGLAETALLSALLLYWWHREHFEALPFDSLGWAGMAVRSVLYAFHIGSGDVMAFALSLSLKAASEAAIDAGLAAIAWWAYGFLSRGVETQRRTERYGICLLLMTCGLGIANNSYFWRPRCSDCFAPHGIPFTFFHEGGYAGGAGFVWTGVLENTVVVLIVALVSGLVWNRLAAQTPV
jgi:hypothetical protein